VAPILDKGGTARPAAPPDALPVTELAADPADRRTVLVVDDVAAVGSFVVYVLVGGGYDVQLAFDQSGAIAAARAGRIDLLLSDVVLEDEFDGLDVGDAVRAIQPDVKVLFMSGQGATRFASSIRDALIEKPFTAAQLLERVESALAD
jgi:DNA-binding NtrC family response regulator